VGTDALQPYVDADVLKPYLEAQRSPRAVEEDKSEAFRKSLEEYRNVLIEARALVDKALDNVDYLDCYPNASPPWEFVDQLFEQILGGYQREFHFPRSSEGLSVPSIIVRLYRAKILAATWRDLALGQKGGLVDTILL
jgi:hypothetical protein